MYHLQLQTTHFEFNAYGETEEDAIEAMGQATNKHAVQYGLSFDWCDEYEYSTFLLVSGSAFRDGERLIPED